MDNTIEAKFFAEFQNGAAAMCLEYIKRVIVRKKEKLDEWESKYYSAFPAEVADRTDSFDDIAWPINIVGEYRIAQEISDNLDKCKDDGQRERYIIEILSVFEDWGAIFTPVARLKELQKMRQNGLSIYSEQEIEQEIERVSNLHDDYLDIMRGAEKGSMRYYLDVWHRAFFRFANMLAAICTEHQINLLEIQAKRGIWIIENLSLLDLQCYFGNKNYANNLLKELPRTAATEALIFTERDGVINSEAVWNSNNYEPQQMELKDLEQPTQENTIEHYIASDDKETTIQAIKSLVCGKKGKQAAVYIYVAVYNGYMSKPTFDILKEAFGIIGTKQAFNTA